MAAYRLLIADVYELAGISRDTSETLAVARGQTAARWHVMSVVSEAPATVPAVARRLGQARQSVQRIVNDLAAEDLVELVDNPAHARSALVALTSAGAAVTADLFEATAAVRADLLARAGVSTDDLVAARATIRSILDAFDG